MRRHSFRPALRALATATCVLSSLALALGAAAGPVRPTLEAVRGEDGFTRIYASADIDGTPHRTLLRETAAQVVVRRTGADPAGRALFATWHEDGQTWQAISRDRGLTWAQTRAIETRLALRDGRPEPGAPMPMAPAALTAAPGARVFVVQFATIAIPEWRSALASAGAEILQHLPHNAYLVRVDPALVSALATFDFVARVEPYHPWYRVSPEVRAWIEAAGAAADTDARRIRVMAYEWGPAGKARIAEHATALGGATVELFPSGHNVEFMLTPSQARSLAHHDDVLWLEAWAPRETDMDLVREDAGTNFIEATLGYCGQGVRGEVLDQGIQVDHPDFDGVLLHKNANSDSHGTSTYGIVFGNGARDGDGEARGTGHLPCAEQGIFSDFNELGDRFVHTQELLQAPYFAHFQSNSWGDATTTLYNSISAEMDDIIWRLDFAILNSQSNTGNRSSRPQAWAKNVISVGGIRHYDNLSSADDAWAGGASIGPAEDGRIKPDINYWYDSIYTTTTGSGYTSNFGGTSGATPESAGVLGVMIQMWANNVWGTDPEGATVFEKLPSATLLKALLINNAQQYPFTGEGADLTRVHQGWGRPSAKVAYERATRSFIVDEEINLELSEIASFDIDVDSGDGELKVTMIYPDPPGTTSSTLHRINDVDLRVTSPSGIVYYGNNGLKAGNYSTPGGSPNGIDTVENVFIQAPEDGLWRVEIEAREINQDAVLETTETDVTFGLVVTGGTGSLCDGPAVSFTMSPNPSQVGSPVVFDATATGGAGGPYTFAWEMNGDTAIDATVEDPTFTYRRPYDGLVRLKVRDAEGCPSRAEAPMVVTGPDLRYDGQISLVEVDGNGNGAVDPGEVFDVVLALRNDGNENASGVTASLVPAASQGSTSVLVDDANFGNIAIGASAAGATPYRFQVGQNFVCGNDATFSLVAITSASPSNVYPEEIGQVRVLVGGSGPPTVFFTEGFEATPGWSGGASGEWQIGAPQGLGGGAGVPGFTPKPDPTAAYQGLRVMGNDLTGVGTLSGNYENNVDSYYTSPALDCSDAIDVSLRFAKWLNVLPNDVARVQASANGLEWTTIYETSDDIDAAWSLLNFDVSQWADRNARFQLRYGIQSDSAATTSGWNIDALELSGVTSSSCEPVSRGLPGVSVGLDVARGTGDALTLTWGTDCGSGSRYGVYRGDLTLGYASLAPIACDITGTSTSITPVPGTAEFFLVVPSDAAFEGSYGATSTGTPRAPSATPCHPQDLLDACAP